MIEPRAPIQGYFGEEPGYKAKTVDYLTDSRLYDKMTIFRYDWLFCSLFAF